MDFIRILLFGTFLGLASLSQAQNSDFGIALIHGTKDHRQDADGVYWKKEFSQAIAQGLVRPENIHIVACDFDQTLWSESSTGCLASQLLKFIESHKLKSVLVITHSHGGNMMRWVLSNPTYHPDFNRLHGYIKEVIALAPSSAGTPLADAMEDGNIFESSLAWLLGYNSAAVRQQQENEMLIANDQFLLGTSKTAPLGVPFKTLIGTDVWASPISGSSYCNGYMLNVGLKVTKVYLEKCSDGFLNCSSQSHAGSIWFKDVEKTENQMPLSHNQSRHTCFGLEKILVDEIKQLEARS